MPSDPPLPCDPGPADHSGALQSRERHSGGAVLRASAPARDRIVDASIYGTLIAMQSLEINYTSITGNEPERAGRGASVSAWRMGRIPHQCDGHICIAGVDEKRWPSFCKIAGIENLEKDPEYSDNVTRNFHGAKIQTVPSTKSFRAKAVAKWLKETYRRRYSGDRGVVDYRSMLKKRGRRASMDICLNSTIPSPARFSSRARRSRSTAK